LHSTSTERAAASLVSLAADLSHELVDQLVGCNALLLVAATLLHGTADAPGLTWIPLLPAIVDALEPRLFPDLVVGRQLLDRSTHYFANLTGRPNVRQPRVVVEVPEGLLKGMRKRGLLTPEPFDDAGISPRQRSPTRHRTMRRARRLPQDSLVFLQPPKKIEI
jgi:hypothetical protein